MSDSRVAENVPEPYQAICRAIARASGVAACLVATVVLVGWATSNESLKSISPSFVAMKANTAIGLGAAGIALILIHVDGLRARVAVRVLAPLVGLLGLAVFFEYNFNLDLGIDELLFKEELVEGSPNAVGTASPGRFAYTTAICFMALGAALLGMTSRAWTVASQVFSLSVALIGLMSVVGYLYGVQAFQGIFSYEPMALHTGLALVALGVGAAASVIDHGFMRVLVSPGLGGVIVRRLLPVVILFPLALGLVRVLGQRAGLYPAEFGTTLFAITTLVALTWVVWQSSARIDRLDEERRRALAELELANRSQRDFIAAASHELRTPLTSVMGYIDLAKDSGPLNEEQSSALEVAGRNTNRLYRLMDDLMSLLRREQRHLEETDLDLADIAHDSVTTAQPVAQARKVNLILSVVGPAPVRGDKEQLSQAADNLISNAIKFTGSGGHVEVVVSTSNGFCECRITDSGIGISSEDQRKLFTKFFRSENVRDKQIQGTGLGLSIVKTIVETHGGSIHVESEQGKGSTFCLRLPVAT